MSRVIDVTARLVARRAGRAVPIRETYAVAGDPQRTFGIAFIKIVSEEIVQAVAFGELGQEPEIVTRWNPLSRDSSDLERFAVRLDGYLTSCCTSGLPPRVWLPHASALSLVELLGHRYRTNTTASDTLRRLGWLCGALADEARIPGQQVVAIGSELLRSHFVTGQSPIKDGHLGAMLAWMNPPVGSDPAAEADARALKPASGVLERRADEHIEKLRKDAKKGGRRRQAEAIAAIAALLEAGARDEWENLLAARAAFWGAGLAHAPGTGDLVAKSFDRFRYRVDKDVSPASRPHALARELDVQERAAELVEEIELCGDARLRERARRKGRAIRGEVVRVVQPKSSRIPCTVDIRTDQEVLRVRPGTVLQRIDGKVVGRVESVFEEDGRRIIRVDLTKGVLKSVRPAEGSTGDWVDAVTRDPGPMMTKVWARMQAGASPLVYGRNAARATELPAAANVDLLAVSEGLRK